MTIITKVGASYVDHMNDDAPEVDNFSRGCYQALSSPVFKERAWGRGYYGVVLVSLAIANRIAKSISLSERVLWQLFFKLSTSTSSKYLVRMLFHVDKLHKHYNFT